MHHDVGRIATRLLGALAHELQRPLDEEGVGDLEDDAVALAAGKPKCVRPVRSDVDRKATLRPGDLHGNSLDLDGVSAAELADDVDRALEVGELRRAALHQPDGAVPLADPADHAPASGCLFKRGEGARQHRCVAGARVRDAGPELEPFRLRREIAEQRVDLAPEDVRVPAPRLVEARLLRELDELERAADGGIPEADSEFHARYLLQDGAPIIPRW